MCDVPVPMSPVNLAGVFGANHNGNGSNATVCVCVSVRQGVHRQRGHIVIDLVVQQGSGSR